MEYYSNSAAGRQAVVDAYEALQAQHLNTGAAGNVSALTEDGMLITPTGIAASQLQAGQIVHMSLDGEVDAGQCRPSSEWRMHADIYREKPGTCAVVHCHSPYATILACARKTIPCMHYMVAAAGGREIPLADYATFGSQALATANMAALRASRACLLANHGQLSIGKDLDAAVELARLVEELAHCYWGTLLIGGPALLNAEQMDEVVHEFAHYGQASR